MKGRKILVRNMQKVKRIKRGENENKEVKIITPGVFLYIPVTIFLVSLWQASLDILRLRNNDIYIQNLCI